MQDCQTLAISCMTIFVGIDIPSSLSSARGGGGRQLRRVLPAGAQLGASDPGGTDSRPRPRVGAPHRTVSHFRLKYPSSNTSKNIHQRIKIKI